MDGLREMILPICAKACFRFSVRFHDRQDIMQEVAHRILRRLHAKGLSLSSDHYIRFTAKLEANKLCVGVSQQRQTQDFIRREAQRRCSSSGRRICHKDRAP